MRSHPGPYLIESYPALPESVPRARHALTEFAAASGAVGEQLDEIRLAASEALSNVVIHAYRDGEPGRIYVTAAMAGGELWMLIADDGQGLRAHRETAGLGMGLALIANASQDLAIVDRANGGTEVRMRFDLRAGDAEWSAQPRGSVASATSPA